MLINCPKSIDKLLTFSSFCTMTMFQSRGSVMAHNISETEQEKSLETQKATFATVKINTLLDSKNKSHSLFSIMRFVSSFSILATLDLTCFFYVSLLTKAIIHSNFNGAITHRKESILKVWGGFFSYPTTDSCCADINRSLLRTSTRMFEQI